MGGVYIAKVSGRLVPVRVDEIRSVDSKFHPKSLRYDVTNQKTGRKTTFRSAAKFRRPYNLASDVRSYTDAEPVTKEDWAEEKLQLEGHAIERQLSKAKSEAQILANKMRDEGISGGITKETQAEMNKFLDKDCTTDPIKDMMSVIEEELRYHLDDLEDQAKLLSSLDKIIRSHLQGMEIEKMSNT